MDTPINDECRRDRRLSLTVDQRIALSLRDLEKRMSDAFVTITPDAFAAMSTHHDDPRRVAEHMEVEQ